MQLAGLIKHDSADRTKDADQSDTAPQYPSVHPHSNVLLCRDDSSLDLDKDSAAVFLEDLVVLGPGSVASRGSEWGGYETGSSDFDARPA